MTGWMRAVRIAACGCAMVAAAAGALADEEKILNVYNWNDYIAKDTIARFEKETGIKVDFTLLPIDALSARLKGELNGGSPDIDIIQWTATFAGWLAPHMADHAKLLADNAGKHPDFDWDDFLPAVRDMASYQGKLLGIPYRVTTSILNYQKTLLAEAALATSNGGRPAKLALATVSASPSLARVTPETTAA